MNTLLQKLFGLGFVSDLVEGINGSKTITGLVSLVLYSLHAIPTVFADIGLSPDLAVSIEKALLWLGVTLVPVGLAHKGVKKLGQ